MLGHFLEFSFAARPLAASFEFYRALGLRSVPVGDLIAEPCAIFYDGTIAIGVHDRDGASSVLTFVRPQLKEYARAIRRGGIAFAEAHLNDDEFNSLTFEDPNGQAIALLEARTFPPGEWDEHNVSACGAFLEYSLATESIERSRAFWEPFGFTEIAAGDAPHPWVRIAALGLVLGLHESRFRSGLAFRTEQIEARIEYLRAKHLDAKRGAPIGDAEHSATLTAPEGTPLYLLGEA
jgi:hypothetical protein